MHEMTHMKPKKEQHKHTTFAGVSLSDNAFKPILEAVSAVSKAFDSIESDFQRDKIKVFMCSKTLLEAESAIEKQYKMAISGDQKALQNVHSGMEYWKKLVMKEINHAIEVTSQ